MCIAFVSFSLGKRWSLQEVEARCKGVRNALQESSFPLTPTVVDSLAELTGTEISTLSDSFDILFSSLPLSSSERAQLQYDVRDSAQRRPNANRATAHVGGRSFLLFIFERSPAVGTFDHVRYMAVLFDEASIEDAGRRAALLPLLTGLSTIVLLTTLMIAMTTRLIARLVRLERGVGSVAAGDFDFQVSDESTDEVGRLGKAVDHMASQLKKLWQEVDRQQKVKLLHQIASGMAHQLRNTLTGARMAMELHQQSCPATDCDEIDVAIRQTEVAEDYVRRLLLVGAEKQDADRPANLRVCLRDVQSSLVAVAKHLRVSIQWSGLTETSPYQVQDGPSFSAALSNLVLNAIQAGNVVDVSVQVLDGCWCRVIVADNGPGIEVEIAEDIFAPFVTSKPEGMGLGLPLVKRAAEKLGGNVEWYRKDDSTNFELRCRVRRIEKS